LGRLRGLLEGAAVHKQLTRLRQWVYRRSLAKNIGVIELIDELLAEAKNEQDTRLLAQLRAEMDEYRRHRLRPH
jgi:hypothetical protein